MTFTSLSLLALASTVLAVPHAHQNHARFHSQSGSASMVSSKLNATGHAHGTNSASWSGKTSTKTATRLHTSTTTVCVTQTTTLSSVSAASVSETPCVDVVTVTDYDLTTMWVIGGQTVASTGAPSSSESVAPSSSSVWVAPTSSSVSVAEATSSSVDSSSSVWTSSSSSAAWTPSSSSSSSIWTPSSSSSSVWTPSSSSTSSTWVPPPTSSAVPMTSSAAPTTSSAAPTTPSSTSVVVSSTPAATSSSAEASSTPAVGTSDSTTVSSGKRGLAYNEASLTSAFANSELFSWAYNWASSSDGLASDISYIPLLWGATPDFTNSWSANAQSAISAGATHLFGFNEPDESSQSNMSPAAAATAWMTYMEPFAGKAQLCAPAVTNGGGSMGLTWLQNFLDACTDCTIDCIGLHWYAPVSGAADGFKSHVQSAMSMTSGKPIYVSEFGLTGASDSQVSSFLEEVMPWMDSQDQVAGYAYYMVADGYLMTGNAPSSYGMTYKSFT